MASYESDPASDDAARALAQVELDSLLASVGLSLAGFHDEHAEAAEQLTDYFVANGARFHDVIPAASELLAALDAAIAHDDEIPAAVTAAMEALREELYDQTEPAGPDAPEMLV